LCASLPAAAQHPAGPWRVQPGAEIVLGTYYEARHEPGRRACIALRAPAVQILQTARQGTLAVRRAGRALTRDEPHCPHWRAPVAMLVYRAAADARGEEEVSWRVTYQSGELGARIFRGRIVIGR